MKQRRGVQVDRILAEVQRINPHHQFIDDIAVGQHDALWKARRAAGIEYPQQVVIRSGAVLDLFSRCCQRLVGDHSVRKRTLADIDDGLERKSPAQFGNLGDEIVVHQQDLRFGVLERILVFGNRPPRVERHDHRAGPGNGEEQLDIAIAVEREDGDTIALFHAELREPAGDPGHPPGNFAPGPPSAGMNRRNVISALLRCGIQRLRQFHRALPLSSARPASFVEFYGWHSDRTWSIIV